MVKGKERRHYLKLNNTDFAWCGYLITVVLTEFIVYLFLLVAFLLDDV